MDLLDRYLQSIKKYLPWQRQGDILDELRANLESQLEDKEAEAGRPLSSAEVEAWLKELGPPMQMAARYQPQQYLIGPTIFPTYWYVLRLVFLWALIIYSIVSAVRIGLGQVTGIAVLEAIFQTPFVLFTAAVWVTLIFAIIEFALMRYPGKCPPQLAGFYANVSHANWIPSGLPPLERETQPGRKRKSYAQAMAEFIFGFLFLLYLLLVPQHPVFLFGPGVFFLHTLPFQLAPVWMQFYWWLVALNVLQIVWRAWDLWRGSWQRPHPIQLIVFKAMALIPIFVALSLRDHALVTLKNPALDQARYGGTLDTINRSLHLSVGWICAIVTVQLLWHIGSLGVDVYRKRAAGSGRM